MSGEGRDPSPGKQSAAFRYAYVQPLLLLLVVVPKPFGTAYSRPRR